MPKIIMMISAALFAALLSSAAQATPSDASQFGVAGAAAAPVRLATIVCGTNGCGAVQTKHQPKRKFQTMGHG